MNNFTVYTIVSQAFTIQFYCFLCKLFRNVDQIEFSPNVNNDDDIIYTCNICNDTSINPPLQQY